MQLEMDFLKNICMKKQINLKTLPGEALDFLCVGVIDRKLRPLRRDAEGDNLCDILLYRRL